MIVRSSYDVHIVISCKIEVVHGATRIYLRFFYQFGTGEILWILGSEKTGNLSNTTRSSKTTVIQRTSTTRAAISIITLLLVSILRLPGLTVNPFSTQLQRTLHIRRSFSTSTTLPTMEEKTFSLVFCRRVCEDGSKEVLLGMKKRGFGVGKWNGYGGKLDGDETIERCATRELEEESGIVTTDVTRKGYIVFKMLELNQLLRVHVYETWNFQGEAVETDEMRPKWYKESEIPFDTMWVDDKLWLPLVLAGKTILARFECEDNDTILDYEIKLQE